MKKLWLLILAVCLSAVYAAKPLLGCDKVTSEHDFNAAPYSKQCFKESLKKYHARHDYKMASSQKISLPIIRNFIAGRSLA